MNCSTCRFGNPLPGLWEMFYVCVCWESCYGERKEAGFKCDYWEAKCGVSG